ncbi:type IV pilus assembly protein PilM [Oceanimonas sp. CHS3-5]|uniref:type IV pilus assembly protein PilM n=1 Tax=Oceanimonas sp. CHS3-5 TaxID=3068186 RepID=UPI00273D5453|nr:type IV pilus assembly protein PilM [Oceanimonas sp. CHS3-5]MDP5292229.1 type IV pilus assembly protein PilM [Oceanimonas sp. CHS3-5]
MFSLTGKRDVQWMVGVDFGTGSLKAVVLKGQRERMQLAAMASVPTPANSIIDHQLQDIEAVGEALKQLRRQLGSRIDRVATAVTGSSVTTKIIALPRGLSDDDLENQVMLEAGQHIPFPLEEISLDFERLGPSQARPDRENILLSAARTDSISTRLAALQLAGWEAGVVDIGVHAVARAAQALLQAEQADVGLLALADIGAECLTFGVMEQGEVIHSRLQNFGGAHFTRELSQLSGIPETQADAAKLEHTLPEPLLDEASQRHITAILQHIRRNLQIFQSSSGSQPPQALFLSGGGSQLAQLAPVLEQELAMPVFVPRFERLLGGDERQYAGAAAYTTALGLALRSFSPCQI